MELEKKKAKKLAEQKKSVDTRLEQEMKRNTTFRKKCTGDPLTCTPVDVFEY